MEVLEVPTVPNKTNKQPDYLCTAIETQPWSQGGSEHITYKEETMAEKRDKQQYFQELLAAKFNRQDLGSIAKAWGRSAEEARTDFVHIQKLYDGMVMYMERYVEAKIP